MKYNNNKFKELIKTNKDYSSYLKSCIDINYTEVSATRGLSMDFILEFLPHLNLEMLVRFQKLSEEFLESNSDNLRWDLIAVHQDLNEDFIRKHQEKWKWSLISLYQELSTTFKEEFKDKLYPDLLPITISR